MLKGAGAGALAVGTGGLLAACGSGIKGTGGSSSTGTINIGFITPLTGPLAGFASGYQFVLSRIRSTSAYKNGIKVGGKKYKVNIVVMDSQSSPTRAGQVAQQLALQNKVDLILTTSTRKRPTRWRRSARSRGRRACPRSCRGNRGTRAWAAIPWRPLRRLRTAPCSFSVSRSCMYPNDSDGTAFREGFEPLIKASNYKVVDGGATRTAPPTSPR